MNTCIPHAGWCDLEAEEPCHLADAIDERRESCSRPFDDRTDPGLALGVLGYADQLEGIGRPFPASLPPGQLITACSPG